MTINNLSEMATTLLAISLASERVVTIAKTAFLIWLADEKKTDAQEVDLVADRTRRLIVLAIAFASSWVTASFLADGDGVAKLIGVVPFGNAPTNFGIPVWIIGLLASGGSSLWSNFLGYTKAVKDVQTQRKASEGLTYSKAAKEQGLITYDSGNAARRRMTDPTLNQLTSLTDPPFTIADSRVKRP